MIHIRQLGLMPYDTIWKKMQEFTANRTESTNDELWILEHPPVYTQGQAGKAEHILDPKDIPIIKSDRGGQVTYHAPGQLIGYVLIDLRKRHIGIRTLVNQLEQILISTIGHFNIKGHTRFKAPGVYVGDCKIASIGLRVRNFCTYHGIALNVAMDLEPFKNINPCGFSNLQVTQIKEFVPSIRMEEVQQQFIQDYLNIFGASFAKTKMHE